MTSINQTPQQSNQGELSYLETLLHKIDNYIDYLSCGAHHPFFRDAAMETINRDVQRIRDSIKTERQLSLYGREFAERFNSLVNSPKYLGEVLCQQAQYCNLGKN